jgi:hypothetical protein
MQMERIPRTLIFLHCSAVLVAFLPPSSNLAHVTSSYRTRSECIEPFGVLR